MVFNLVCRLRPQTIRECLRPPAPAVFPVSLLDFTSSPSNHLSEPLVDLDRLPGNYPNPKFLAAEREQTAVPTCHTTSAPLAGSSAL